jgi:NitT/TauT family transport system substrate-binding protein
MSSARFSDCRVKRLRLMAQAAGAGCAALLVVLAGLDAPVRGADPVTIRVGATANDTAAEVYYADELGMFKKRGIVVDIANQRNGAAEAAAVAGGALDIGEQNIVSMSRAHDRNLPFKFIAPAGVYDSRSSTTSLVVAANSTTHSGKDLEGKTVAVNALGDLTQIGAESWIDKHGGDSSKVHFIEMPAPEIGAAVSRATIEAGVIPEPSLTQAQDADHVRILAQPYDGIASRFMINGWFANADWIAKNGPTAKNFADAIYEASKWANTHRADSAKILAKHSKVDAGVIARMRRATYGDKFDTKALQTVIETAVRYHGLSKSFDANEVIVNAFPR